MTISTTSIVALVLVILLMGVFVFIVMINYFHGKKETVTYEHQSFAIYIDTIKRWYEEKNVGKDQWPDWLKQSDSTYLNNYTLLFKSKKKTVHSEDGNYTESNLSVTMF